MDAQEEGCILSWMKPYFGAMAAGVPSTPLPSHVDTNPVLSASDYRVFQANPPIGSVILQNVREQNDELAAKDEKEKAEEALQEDIISNVIINQINQVAERFREVQQALNDEDAMRYQGLMEQQSTIDMEVKNSYDYKNAMHDTVMIDDEGNVYVAEEDIDGNYTHYRVNPDGTKEIDPDADEKIASGKLRGIYMEGDHYATLDGTRLSDQQAESIDQTLRGANTSLRREARNREPAHASAECHDAREAAVNANGQLETLQYHHVTITEDNVSDIFLDTQAAKLKAVETQMNYAVAMANHEGNTEKAAAAAKDLKNFQAKVEEFTQLRIKADALTPMGKASLLEQGFGEEWKKFRSEKLQPMNAAAPVARQSSTPAPVSASYGERTTSHVQDDNGIQSPKDLKLSRDFNVEAPGDKLTVQVPAAPAQQPPAPVVRMLSGAASHCA